MAKTRAGTSTSRRRRGQVTPMVPGLSRYALRSKTRYAPRRGWRLSQSRRASLMRVCHPLPVLLNASTTSVSRRMLRCSFGEAEGGRPRRRERSSLAVFLPTTSDSTSAAGRARLNQSAVASGASSSMSSGSGLRGISVPFATVGSAQADHVNRPITRGKHEHVQLIMDQAQGLEAALTVFLPDVLDDQSRVPLEVVCQGEREAATLDVSLVLGRIEGDRHAGIVPTVYSVAGQKTKIPTSIALTIVSSVSFLGFLMGPPLIGYISSVTNLRYSYALIGLFGICIVALASIIRVLKEDKELTN